jgi:hypothetical protein
MRLAQGQIRPVLADRAIHHGRDDARPGCFEDSHIIAAVMRTNKLDIADLKRAYDGEAA